MLVDDQRLVRGGLMLVNSQPDLQVVMEGWTGLAAIDADRMVS